MKYDAKDLTDMANAVRANALRAVRSAHSGHIGIVLGASDIITSVYANFMHCGSDRFVLSAGHGSAMLYSVLKLAGYDIGDLTSFRKMGGLPGHPEMSIPGVDATTGPLGQGVGMAVGYAIAHKIQKKPGKVFCLCSDGDLMEGISAEAITFAGRYRLDNLILLWDDNRISIDGVAQTDFQIPMRMKAAGWNVLKGVDGHDFAQINRALDIATKSGRPTFIQCKTEIGHDSSVAGTAVAHGLGIGDIELDDLIQKYTSLRGETLWNAYSQSRVCCLAPDMHIQTPMVDVIKWSGDISTRKLSAKYLQELLFNNINLIGGSADLGGNTGARVESSVHITTKNNYTGNYINYGVREHAMGAIMNGIAAAGLRPYGSTFLAFSDYMRPAIRIAALSKLPVIYVFSHDSVAVGEDGPTHQPIEQLASLRLIPNLNVFRPCNSTEVAYAWQTAVQETSRPSAIILSRQDFPQIETPTNANAGRGGYIIMPANKRDVKITLIATGSEVPLAVSVAGLIGDDVQVVSMPSVEIFRAQSDEYKQQIMRGFVVAIEAAASSPWFEFADAVVGIDKFGFSGDGKTVYKQMGMDANAIATDILDKIKR
ncbi:MAG: transketolase [Proteobacteria bacterium]|nr:transketolase [Candidatus Enterousia scatequi]